MLDAIMMIALFAGQQVQPVSPGAVKLITPASPPPVCTDAGPGAVSQQGAEATAKTPERGAGLIVQGGREAGVKSSERAPGLIVQGGKAPSGGLGPGEATPRSIVVQGGKVPSSGIVVQGGREHNVPEPSASTCPPPGERG